MLSDVNSELVAQLKSALELAQSGKITDGIIVAVGPDAKHHSFSIPHAAAELIGELTLVSQAIGMRVIADRAKAPSSPIVALARKPLLQS
jgi:hypothetical protein